MPKKGRMPAALKRYWAAKRAGRTRRAPRMARRMKRSYRRYRSKRSHRKPGMFSKITSAIALGIGLGPVIGRFDEYVIKGGGNLKGFATVTAGDYSFGLADLGTFSLSRGYLPYGAIAGAVIFKKAMGYLGRMAKF